VAEVRLSAESRTEFGKGGARRTRRAGKIPAVIYGHGADPRHVSLPAREFANAIRHSGANVLLTLEVDGGEQLAIPKAIQRDAIKGVFEHVDLLAVRRGEKVTIDVPVHIVGEIASGAFLSQEATTVSLEAEATHIPTSIEVNVEGLDIGAHLTAGDLTLPTGSTLAVDASQSILIVQEAPSAEAMEADTGGPADESDVAQVPAAEGDAAGAAGGDAGAESAAE
jgi:large subunit ribosomal protein L25